MIWLVSQAVQVPLSGPLEQVNTAAVYYMLQQVTISQFHHIRMPVVWPEITLINVKPKLLISVSNAEFSSITQSDLYTQREHIAYRWKSVSEEHNLSVEAKWQIQQSSFTVMLKWPTLELKKKCLKKSHTWFSFCCFEIWHWSMHSPALIDPPSLLPSPIIFPLGYRCYLPSVVS